MQINTSTRIHTWARTHTGTFARLCTAGQRCAMVLLIASAVAKVKDMKRREKQHNNNGSSSKNIFNFQCHCVVLRACQCAGRVQYVCACVLYISLSVLNQYLIHIRLSRSRFKVRFCLCTRKTYTGMQTQRCGSLSVSLFPSLFNTCSNELILFISISLPHSLAQCNVYSLDSFVEFVDDVPVCAFFLLLFWCVRIRILSAVKCNIFIRSHS